MKPKTQQLEVALFWARVKIPTGGGTGIYKKCWPWMGPTAGGRKRRYGVFRRSNPRRADYAHRVALEFYLGRPIRSGLYALHSCNNHICANPLHIYEGTQKQNMEDYRRAGGTFITTPKLTPAKVRRIRRLMRRMPTTDKILAEYFGVSCPTITNIRNNKVWQTVS